MPSAKATNLPVSDAPAVVTDNARASESLVRLLDIMAQLRTPETGCPWDLQQTMTSLTRYTIEEAYEVADAIAKQDMSDICDELGDLLFQIVFYARIAQENGDFAFADVANAISDKLIRRHPHVFGDGSGANMAASVATESTEVISQTPEALNQQWEAIKQQERDAKQLRAGEQLGQTSDSINNPRTTSILDSITDGLPALMRAQKIQKTVAKIGFDWPDIAPVKDKIREELDEIDDALANGSHDDVEDEIGDLLFAVVNLARHCRVDADTALRRANHKFSQRFHSVEAQAQKGPRGHIDEYTLDELEAFWQRAKQE